MVAKDMTITSDSRLSLRESASQLSMVAKDMTITSDALAELSLAEKRIATPRTAPGEVPE